MNKNRHVWTHETYADRLHGGLVAVEDNILFAS
jgi:hypothetical protein